MWLAGQLSPLSICFTDHFRFTQSLCFINRLVPEVNGLGWHSWYSDLLWAGPLRDQSQWGGGAGFYAPLQVALGTILLCSGYQVSFRVVEQLGCDVNHTPPSSTEVKEYIRLLPFKAFMSSSRVNVTLCA